jgi:hypothetical protein
MMGVAVAGENNDFVATILQSYRGIDDQSLSTSNPKVGMEECDRLLLRRF